MRPAETIFSLREEPKVVGLKPWHAVVTSHEDIREGKPDEAVFAANRWALVQGTAPDVYLETRRNSIEVDSQPSVRRSAIPNSSHIQPKS